MLGECSVYDIAEVLHWNFTDAGHRESEIAGVVL
jgi:hypothetical protein